jgi:hypothetical protein
MTKQRILSGRRRALEEQTGSSRTDDLLLGTVTPIAQQQNVDMIYRERQTAYYPFVPMKRLIWFINPRHQASETLSGFPPT